MLNQSQEYPDPSYADFMKWREDEVTQWFLAMIQLQQAEITDYLGSGAVLDSDNPNMTQTRVAKAVGGQEVLEMTLAIAPNTEPKEEVEEDLVGAVELEDDIVGEDSE